VKYATAIHGMLHQVYGQGMSRTRYFKWVKWFQDAEKTLQMTKDPAMWQLQLIQT